MFDISGKSFGHYRVIEKLGGGGMGSVYLAEDTTLDRKVAIKVILPGQADDENFLKYFEGEARAMARLTHPNIVPVIGWGKESGTPYLVLPFIPGGTLGNRLEAMSGPMPWQEAVKLLTPVARALDYAHCHHIIHRDIKPANILLSEDGIPEISDFGVAKIVDSSKHFTSTVIGTPQYMAPEQFEGSVSAQSDIYALGIVFYELVARRRPFEGSFTDILRKHLVLKEPPPPVRLFNPLLPEAVAQVIHKALERMPVNRFISAAEFAGAMEDLSLHLTWKNSPALMNKQPNERGRGEVAPVGEDIVKVKQSARQAITPYIPPSFFQGREEGVQAISPEEGGKSVDLPDGVIGKGDGGEGMVLRRSTPSFIGGAVFWLVCLLAVLGVGYATGGFGLLPTPTPSLLTTPTPSVTATQVSRVDGMVMVNVPAGEFLMGAVDGDQEAAIDEKPQHTIYLNDFWIDKTEVTEAMYSLCVQAGACTKRGGYGNRYFPMINVNWNDATAYCRWVGGRLPTEAEWEKAARGTGGRLYPWGDNISCTKANFSGCGSGSPVVVGSYPDSGSPYGALDMAGNVWEWVNDWYQIEYFQISPGRNPAGPINGSYRVARGGSWFDDGGIVRASSRSSRDPATGKVDLGFRCVR